MNEKGYGGEGIPTRAQARSAPSSQRPNQFLSVADAKACENLLGQRIDGVGRQVKPPGDLFLGVTEEKQSNVARLRFQAGSLATSQNLAGKLDQRLLGLSAEGFPAAQDLPDDA